MKESSCIKKPLSDEIINYISKFNSDEELLRSGGIPINMLDRLAFGFTDDINTLNPDQLKIRWIDDLENVKWEIKNNMWEKPGEASTIENWASHIDLSEPIDVDYWESDDWKRGFYIQDGHHRYYAAKILGKPLNVNLTVKVNPIKELSNLGYDEFHRCLFKMIKKMNEIRKIVREVLRESFINEIIEDSFDAFHGSGTEIKKFTDDFVGGEKANDAQGAGIYFATNPEDASHYGDYIYKVRITGNFLNRNAPIDNVDPEELVKLIKMKDDWEMNAQDYSEDPESGAYEAARMAIQYNGDEAEAFQQIEADFYRYDSVDYVKNMTKLGYDGIIVDAPSEIPGDKHIIVFNVDAVKLTGKA